MTAHGVDKCQTPVSFGATLVDEHAVHDFAKHRLDRVAVQTIHPHLRRSETFNCRRLLHYPSPLGDSAHCQANSMRLPLDLAAFWVVQPSMRYWRRERQSPGFAPRPTAALAATTAAANAITGATTNRDIVAPMNAPASFAEQNAVIADW
jgi:hypothetical protein